MGHGSIALGRRRTMAAGLVGVLLTAGLAGCQKVTRVGAQNACGFPIDVFMEETESVSSYHWRRVGDGEHQEVLQATEYMTQSVVFVRRAEGGSVSHFTVLRQDHTAPPAGSDYDLEVVIEGEHCPA